MAPSASRDRLKHEALKRLIWPLLALGLLLLFNLVFTENFFQITVRNGHLYGTPIDILNRGSQLMILALGMTLVIATGGVDLSVGAVMAISGAMSALLIKNMVPWLPGGLVSAVCFAILVAVIAGAWNGLLVSVFRVQPIIATLILMVAGRGIAQLLTDGTIITFEDPQLAYIGNGHLLGLPFPLWIVATMFLITALLTRKTALGLFVESVGNNETACKYAGVNATAVKFLAYVFAGFCAGTSGIIYASNIKCADSNNAGLFFELDAILAVVVGGTALTGGRFYLVGSIVGALLIQTLTTTMYARDVSPYIIPVPKAIFIIVVCLLQSKQFRDQISGLLKAWKTA